MLSESPETLFKTWLREYGGTVLKVARAHTLTAERVRTRSPGKSIKLRV
jgi:hypothetical protein